VLPAEQDSDEAWGNSSELQLCNRYVAAGGSVLSPALTFAGTTLPPGRHHHQTMAAGDCLEGL